jgi:hypothetical protein
MENAVVRRDAGTKVDLFRNVDAVRHVPFFSFLFLSFSLFKKKKEGNEKKKKQEKSSYFISTFDLNVFKLKKKLLRLAKRAEGTQRKC